MITAGLLQLLIATYGGFFGGGSGILMLAMFTVMGKKDIHAMNALKTSLNACINGVATIAFILAGAVAWQQAILMSLGSLLGGYWGVHNARKLKPCFVQPNRLAQGFSVLLFAALYLRLLAQLAAQSDGTA